MRKPQLTHIRYHAETAQLIGPNHPRSIKVYSRAPLTHTWIVPRGPFLERLGQPRPQGPGDEVASWKLLGSKKPFQKP